MSSLLFHNTFRIIPYNFYNAFSSTVSFLVRNQYANNKFRQFHDQFCFKYQNNNSQQYSKFSQRTSTPAMEKPTKTIRFVCVSDTHTLTEGLEVPLGDVFIHAGDFTDYGEAESVTEFNNWLATLPHPVKIVIAGNHEISFDPINYHKVAEERKLPPYDDKIKSILTNCTYLEDSSVTIHGYKIYGTPSGDYRFGSAFNAKPGKQLENIWNKIPSDTEILITHQPPHGILDVVPPGKSIGDEQLLKVVKERVKPLFHIFGHIHEGYGVKEEDGITFINACTCTSNYRPINKPIVFELPVKEQSDTKLIDDEIKELALE